MFKNIALRTQNYNIPQDYAIRFLILSKSQFTTSKVVPSDYSIPSMPLATTSHSIQLMQSTS